MERKRNTMSRYPFATKTGIEMLLMMLLYDGAMCPKCGYGTRVTSKRWAKCKKCGEMVARNTTDTRTPLTNKIKQNDK